MSFARSVEGKRCFAPSNAANGGRVRRPSRHYGSRGGGNRNEIVGMDIRNDHAGERSFGGGGGRFEPIGGGGDAFAFSSPSSAPAAAAFGGGSGNCPITPAKRPGGGGRYSWELPSKSTLVPRRDSSFDQQRYRPKRWQMQEQQNRQCCGTPRGGGGGGGDDENATPNTTYYDARQEEEDEDEDDFIPLRRGPSPIECDRESFGSGETAASSTPLSLLRKPGSGGSAFGAGGVANESICRTRSSTTG